MRTDGNTGWKNHWATRYGLALAMGMLAVAVRWALVPVIGNNVPYITLFPLIMFVSVMWGTGPGVLTTIAGMLLVEYHFMPPVDAIEWDLDFAVRATILLLTSIYVAWIAERLRSSREQAAADASASRASEDKYRLLFHNMAEGFALYELLYDEQGEPADWRVLEVNEAYARHTGINSHQIVGRRIGELYPAARLQYLSRFAEVVSTQHPVTFETYSEVTNRHHRVTSFPAGGSRFANIVADISERKRSEDEVRKWSAELQAANASLHESRQEALNLMDDAVAARKHAEQVSIELRKERDFIAGVLDNTGAMVVVLAPDGRITRFNKACEQITGYAAKDVVGRELWDFLVPPEEAESVRTVWNRLRAGNFPNTHENHWMTRERSRRLIAWSNTAIVSPDGGVEYVIGTGVDITERRKAEEALAESRKDLNRAQAVAKVGSWRLDVRKNELLWSDENWQIFGVPKGTPLKYETFLSTVHPDDRAYVDERWAAALRGEPYDIEHRIVVGDSIKWVQEKVELEFDGSGTLLGGFGTTQDITERKKAEETLRRATADLERSNRDLEQFAYVTSHDLKEPLRMVTSFMGLLQLRYAGRLDDKAREYIGFAVEGATRMQSLVDDLLAYSRAGRQDATERVEADGALDRALANLRMAIEESGALVVRKPLPAIEVNPVELAQVFQNLVGNAIKFRRPGVQPEVRVSARKIDGRALAGVRLPPGEENAATSALPGTGDSPKPSMTKDSFWLFAVRDNGIGIDPQYQHKLFHIFRRLHARDKYPGTGVGLAICKKIVERHGGRIWIESEEGKGSTVLFTFPAARGNDGPAPSGTIGIA